MCEDPIEDAEAHLVVDPADDDRGHDALAAAIEVVGGTVEERLEYGALRVRLPERRVADLCSLAGIDSVQTADVVSDTGDAGEDI
jgi:hypothetical protein